MFCVADVLFPYAFEERRKTGKIPRFVYLCVGLLVVPFVHVPSPQLQFHPVGMFVDVLVKVSTCGIRAISRLTVKEDTGAAPPPEVTLTHPSFQTPGPQIFVGSRYIV